MKSLFFVSLICGIAMLSACQNNTPPVEPTSTDAPVGSKDIAFRKDGQLHFTAADTTKKITDIAIEIAETPESRETGLMYRRSLPDASGMLFIFEQEEPQAFWMANTYISLDLIFVNAKNEVVSVSKYAQPLSTASIESTGAAQYVIEVPAGFADSHGIVAGQKVQFSRSK
jgi:uncharacterized membrane protein (UPF0127 family)